jgi:hypothetical protein
MTYTPGRRMVFYRVCWTNASGDGFKGTPKYVTRDAAQAEADAQNAANPPGSTARHYVEESVEDVAP